jgi:hypothetical protein
VNWVDLVNIAGPYLSAVVSLFGFAFLIHQVRLNARGVVYQLSNQVYKLFVDHPELRPYFYDRQPLPEDEPDRSRVLACAELLTDFFEHIAHTGSLLDAGIRTTWCEYMRHTYQKNPAFASYIDNRRKFYTVKLLDVLGGGFSSVVPTRRKMRVVLRLRQVFHRLRRQL